MSLLVAQLHAVIAIANADIAEHGYCPPRARFVSTIRPIAPREINPYAVRVAALHDVAPADYEERLGDVYVEQLSGGRERVTAMLDRMGPHDLPTGAFTLTSYMHTLPESHRTDDLMFGCYFEIWQARPSLLVLRAVMPLRVLPDGTPELAPLSVLAIEHAVVPESELN